MGIFGYVGEDGVESRQKDGLKPLQKSVVAGVVRESRQCVAEWRSWKWLFTIVLGCWGGLVDNCVCWLEEADSDGMLGC